MAPIGHSSGRAPYAPYPASPTLNPKPCYSSAGKSRRHDRDSALSGRGRNVISKTRSTPRLRASSPRAESAAEPPAPLRFRSRGDNRPPHPRGSEGKTRRPRSGGLLVCWYSLEATVGFEPTHEGFAEPYCYILYVISLIARHYPYHGVCQHGFAE